MPRSVTFHSSHNLLFEAAPSDPLTNAINNKFGENYLRFRVGTCNGVFSYDRKNYLILTINNEEPGNGHFDDVMEWFEQSCVRDKKDLIIQELFNSHLKAHLIRKRGFEPYCVGGQNSVRKSWKKMEAR